VEQEWINPSKIRWKLRSSLREDIVYSRILLRINKKLMRRREEILPSNSLILWASGRIKFKKTGLRWTIVELVTNRKKIQKLIPNIISPTTTTITATVKRILTYYLSLTIKISSKRQKKDIKFKTHSEINKNMNQSNKVSNLSLPNNLNNT
jgi:hypothetical protein